MAAYLRRLKREIDPMSGMPVLVVNSVKNSQGYWDMRFHYPDIDPTKNAPER